MEEIYAYESTCEQVHVFWSAEVVVVCFFKKMDGISDFREKMSYWKSFHSSARSK